MTIKTIHTPKAPKAIGPYSQAVAVSASELILCSGQIALDPATGTVVEGGVEAQTERVLDNIHAVLAAADCTFANVVKTTIFLPSRCSSTRAVTVPPSGWNAGRSFANASTVVSPRAGGGPLLRQTYGGRLAVLETLSRAVEAQERTK